MKTIQNSLTAFLVFSIIFMPVTPAFAEVVADIVDNTNSENMGSETAGDTLGNQDDNTTGALENETTNNEMENPVDESTDGTLDNPLDTPVSHGGGSRSSADASEPVDEELIQDSCLDISLEEIQSMGDVTGDGRIDKADLEILSFHYRSEDTKSTVDQQASDLNNDGVVNFDDLLTLSQNMGKFICDLPNTTCLPVLHADMNGDGVVDMADMELFTPHYNTGVHSEVVREGANLADFNGDAQVDFADLLILAQEFGKTLCDEPAPTCLSGANAAQLLKDMGDITGNGIINQADLDILSVHYNSEGSTSNTQFAASDINNDGVVNFDDLLTLSQNFGKRLCTIPTLDVCDVTLSADINKDGYVNQDDLDLLTVDYNTETAGPTDIAGNDNVVDFSDLLLLAQQYGQYKCDENPTNNNNNGGGSSKKKSKGEVLGAATCGRYLNGFAFPSRANDLDTVVRIQLFLNNYEGAKVPVTGVYGDQTVFAVRAFQAKYAAEIIKPWYEAGLLVSATEPTGNVYLTTQRMINKIVCPTLELPLPSLN